MTIQPVPAGAEKDRSFAAFAGAQIDRPGDAGCEPDGEPLAALADDGQDPVPAFQVQGLDVRARGFGYTKPV